MSIMSMPSRFAFIVVGDAEYKPDAEGKFKVEDPEHIESLKQMGCEVINKIVFAPVTESVTEKPPVVEPKPTPSEAAKPLPKRDIYPTDEWKRAEVLNWLKEKQIAVDPNITKVAALKIVATLKAKG